MKRIVAMGGGGFTMEDGPSLLDEYVVGLAAAAVPRICFVPTASGDAEISADDDYSFANQLGAKYGADLRDRDKPGEARVAVTIKPARIVTWG